MSDNQPAKLPRAQLLTVGGASAVAALLSLGREADGLTPMGLDVSGNKEYAAQHPKHTTRGGNTQESGATKVLIVDKSTRISSDYPPDYIYIIEQGHFCGYGEDEIYSYGNPSEYTFVAVWVKNPTPPEHCPTPPPSVYRRHTSQ
jgi:hypothetical protein